MRGYDAWVTREPPWMDYEPPVYRCSCGAFLKAEAEGTREWVTLSRCNGEANVYADQRHDDRVLAIIGEEHAAETFALAFRPACGSKTGAHEQEGDGEIRPEDAADWKHEPHYYAEPYGWQQCELRTCARCGRINEHVS